MKRLLIAGVVTACALAAACGLQGGAGATAPSGVITIADGGGSPWNCQFNPFAPGDQATSFGAVYEPLAFVDPLENGKTTPWLATAWQWGPGDRTLTFTIRRGVTFSDGSPMTAADVAFTFNLMRRFRGLDTNDIWSALSSVRRVGGDQVRMAFRAVSTPYFYYIADQVPIVPERLWSRIPDPGTYPDSHPVGTGGFAVSVCTSQVITYTANRHYWVPGEPRIATVKYPAFISNDAPTTDLAEGRAQWGGQFIPNIQAVYLSQNPGFRYWFPPITNTVLVPNLTNPLLAIVKVRQAISCAINRNQVANLAEYGYEQPANQAGIVTPTFSRWLSPAALAAARHSCGPARARQLLAAAGFRPGPDGVRVSHGHRLALTVINVAGNSDWVTSMQIIQRDLRAVGIALTPVNLSANSWAVRMSTGDFQLGYDTQSGGPAPYFELRQWLYSGNSAPVGQTANSDYERYASPATDRLFSEYAATTNLAVQHRLISELAQVMLRDVPVIPVTETAEWFEYDSQMFRGWPTAADPYAQPSPFSIPDWGQVLLHLMPTGNSAG